MRRKATCSTRTQTEEEDADEREVDSAKNKADEVRPTKTSPNLVRKTEAIEEPSQERGASILARAVTQSNADIAESSAITKKTTEKRSENRLSRCRDDPIARHGSRGGTAGVLDQKDSTLAQTLARRDLRKNERELRLNFNFRFRKQVAPSRIFLLLNFYHQKSLTLLLFTSLLL